MTEPQVKDGRFDLVAIGETMVAFVAGDDERTFRAIPAGAESNVAAGMAALGCRARWVSRLGDDPLGRFVASSITSRGVDVAAVRDGTRPTGVMTKHVTASGTVAQYYRSESAARALGPGDLERAGRARWMHVTGITAAVSASAADLVDAAVARRSGHDGHVSFDVNYRPALWPDAATAAEVLLPLARRADVVFVGEDEAQALFGTVEPGELAEMFLQRDDQELVVKRGGGPASVITREGAVSEPALPVDVVDATGAGDAFAAGYLAASTFGWPVPARLRLGHLMASRVVGVLDDLVPPLTAAELDSLSPEALAARWAGAGDDGEGTAGPRPLGRGAPRSGECAVHDVYAYGVIAPSTLYELRDEFPAPSGYAEIAATHPSIGGEAAGGAYVLARLGVATKLAGNRLGSDEASARVIAALTAAGVDCDAISREDPAPAVTEVVFAAGDGRTVFGTYRKLLADRAWDEPDRDAIAASRIVCLDPFFTGGSDRAAQWCRDAGIPYVTVDASPDSEVARHAAVLIISEEFAARTFGVLDPEEVAAAYTAQCSGLVIVTHGGGPLRYARRGEAPRTYAPVPVKVRDTTGAGDSFRAGIIYGMLQGLDDAGCVRAASAVAALVCQRVPGVLMSPTAQELEEFLARHPAEPGTAGEAPES